MQVTPYRLRCRSCKKSWKVIGGSKGGLIYEVAVEESPLKKQVKAPVSEPTPFYGDALIGLAGFQGKCTYGESMPTEFHLSPDPSKLYFMNPEYKDLFGVDDDWSNSR